MRMKFRKMRIMVLCVVMSVFVLEGCGASEREVTSDKEDMMKIEATDEEATGEEATDEEATGEAEATDEQATGEADVTDDTENSGVEFTFADISNLEFWFASGAGGWSTQMTIHEDGTFEGVYHDSDMGDVGEGYPNGVMYLCVFEGKFTQPEKVDDYTYSMRIESMKYENESGTEEIMDGIRYVYSEPYGLDGAEEFLIYLPGISLYELPEEYRSWVGYYDLAQTTDTTLPFYGIYNVNPQYGFSSYECVEDSGIDEELAAIEAEASILESELQSTLLNQMELNERSGELYKLWDDELNSIWARLKEKLPEEEMAALLTEQRAWITYKESEVEAAGAEYESGSMRPLIENDRAAELTRERVYELAELLR